MVVTEEMKKSVPFQYASDVLNGKIITGHYIKKACDRFFQWIEEAPESGFHLDHASGMRVINFFPTCLNHTKGKMAGQKFELSPFQQFTMYNVFGWKNSTTNLRRINTIYDKRAKKNGKSAEMAGVSILTMSFDGESEAEIYIGATKEEQAKICWNQARSFIESTHANPVLKKIGFRCKQKEIIFTPTNSILRPLGGDSKTQDGINAHVSIIDEYHAHKDDSVKENLESSSVQRTQPLLWHITTAGVDVYGVCKDYEDVCKEVLDGLKTDDNLWIMIHDLDNDDDWEDESNWVKANPLLGQGLSVSGIRKEFVKAKNQPSKAPNFKTKHLNMWVDAASVRIPDEIWMEGTSKIQLKNFIENGCAGAFDLSSTTDLTAEVYVSNPDEEGYRDILPFFYCPKDTIEKRSKEDRVPYRDWKNTDLSKYIDFSETDLKGLPFFRNRKLLTATPGNQIDYELIQSNITAAHSIFLPKWYDYDDWQATQLAQNLKERNIKLHPFPQTITHFSFPTKEFEKFSYSGKFRHGGHPILRWMISKIVAIMDANENIRYSKKHSTDRIDGVIATVMALAATITEEKKEESKYSKPDAEIYV